MSLSVGGLVSGLDTNSIISQLTALEQAKVTREARKKDAAQSTLDKFKDLETRLGNLQNKAKALELPNDFNVFKALSNHDDVAVVSGSEGAFAGQYELKVYELATTQKVASKAFDAINTTLEGNNGTTLTISTSAAAQKADRSKTTVDVRIDAGDTLRDIVNKINAAEGTGVRASIMTMADGENRLVLTAVDTGTKGFYIKEDGGSDFLGEVLGIVDSAKLQATSGGALLTKTGAANGDTLFTDLDIGLGRSLVATDRMVISIGDTVVSAELEGKDIKTVLDELNNELSSLGLTLTASLNSSGEIVIGGASDNFDPNIKVEFRDSAEEVKRSLGNFSVGNVFNESNVITTAHNAFYTIDGMAIGSQSNSDDRTIAGTTFTLKKADPSVTVKVSLELDMDGLASKINDFIEEFNALMKFIDENSRATIKEETDPNTGRKVPTREIGAFTGDSNISMLRENLRKMVTGIISEITNTGIHTDSGFSTNYSSAARIGITTDREGYLSVNRDALTKALNADFEGVRRLFTANSFSDTPGFSVGRFTRDSQAGMYELGIDDNGSWIKINNGEKIDMELHGSIVSNIWTYKGLSIEVPHDFSSSNGTVKVSFVRGIASQLSNFVEQAKSTVDGYFKKSRETYQKRIDEIEKRVDQLQMRVDSYNKRLTNQFTALERSMANLQTQTSNMMAAMSTMNNNNRR
ncbi:MAG: flagellar filament capping protein FliD [Fibromonadaceae bacterium]|jgi:flagellar hook-associated protein 2|nr:flagellar filament capping protein FliD [Fibromonadaceae bacterium]